MTVSAAQATPPILEVDGLTMRFGGLTAVDSLSFAAFRGDITALIGPNGAGKTTVFNCITGFYKPTSGAVTMRLSDGTTQRLDRLDNHRIASHARVARTFQNIRLFSKLTVLDNVRIAYHPHAGYTLFDGIVRNKAYREQEDYLTERAQEFLAIFGLEQRQNDIAGSLPYGLQRRLEIARCLVSDPELILLDEPFTGIDPVTIDSIQAIIRDLRDRGISILITDHQVRETLEITDRAYVLAHGKKLGERPFNAWVRMPASWTLVTDESATDAQGGYLLAGIRPGNYEARVLLPGGFALDANKASLVPSDITVTR